MRAEGLLWQPGRDEGCVIMADGTGLAGVLEYLVAAGTQERAREIEAACAIVLGQTAAKDRHALG